MSPNNFDKDQHNVSKLFVDLSKEPSPQNTPINRRLTSYEESPANNSLYITEVNPAKQNIGKGSNTQISFMSSNKNFEGLRG